MGNMTGEGKEQRTADSRVTTRAEDAPDEKKLQTAPPKTKPVIELVENDDWLREQRKNLFTHIYDTNMWGNEGTWRGTQRSMGSPATRRRHPRPVTVSSNGTPFAVVVMYFT